MSTPWEAIRPRIWPSVVAMLHLMSVWVPLSGAFFWEPLLIWRLFHGHLGFGLIDGGTIARGMAAWLVPVFAVETLALVMDMSTAASKYDHEHTDSRLQPNEFHAAYSISAPLDRFQIQDFDQYREQCMDNGFWMKVLAWVGVLAWLVAFMVSLVVMAAHRTHLDMSLVHVVSGLVAATLTAWALVALIVTTALAGYMTDPKGSILFLPWRQRWTWIFGLVVLPMAPLYGVAAIRLTVDRRHS